MSLHLATIERTFESWRQTARQLLQACLSPEQVMWTERVAEQPVLAELAMMPQPVPPAEAGPPPSVPPRFVELAKLVACHRDPERWPLLYRVLWRLTHGERSLLEIAVDDDVHALMGLEKRVRFDRHKMTAFVRFREVPLEAGGLHYVAFYRPDHYTVRLTAPFFAKRFATMRWSILTPDDCAHFDGQRVEFTPGVPADGAPDPDQVEGLWRTYYGSIFNPARIKLNAMRKEMPTRFWRLLPEAQDIPDLLNDAPRRVKLMVKNQPPETDGGAAYLPEDRSVDSLRCAVAACKGCPLYGPATQPVFGEGPRDARAMFVGEQPGDQEDLAGRPFVGPAGQLLDQLLSQVGLDRTRIYVTNTVKHFKFEQRGKRRVHAKPSARDVTACLPWLHAEIAAVRPQAILCLGATAAQALLGRDFRMTRDHGKLYTDTPHAPKVMAAIHPSALLRIPEPALRRRTEAEFVEDLQRFYSLLG